MGTYTFAAFDEVVIGAHLSLTNGDLILQTDLTVDAHRMARSEFPIATQGNVEFIFYAPNGGTPSLAPVSGVPPLCYGIATAAASTAKYVGEDVFGFGYCPGDGYVYNNGARLQFVGTSAYGDVNSIAINPANSASATMTVFRNGQPIGSPVTLTPGLAWYYAGTVSGQPGTFAICANAGQTPQRYPLGDVTGFSKIVAHVAPTYLATEPYISAPTDSTPHNKFGGDIDRSQGVPQVSRSVKPWPFGPSAPLSGSTQIQIRVNDPTGAHASLRTDGIRDLPIAISRVRQDDPQANAEAVFGAIVDRIERPSDYQFVIYGKDKLTLLQSSLVRPLFPPTADPSVALKPRPLALGICRTFDLICYDTAGLNYAIGDGTVTAIGRFRDLGKPLVLNSDYSLTPDGAGVHRTIAPPGKFTGETSSEGAAFSPTAPDALTGSGVFDSIGTMGGGVITTSSTTVTVGTGSKAFTVGTGKPFVVGSTSQVSAVSRGSAASMTGTVASYTGGVLTITVTSTTGSITHSDWNIVGGINQPTGWTGGGGYPRDPLNAVFQVQGASGSRVIVQGNTADAIYWLAHQTFTVAAGASYAYSINVTEIPYIGKTVDGSGNPSFSSTPRLTIGGAADDRIAYAYWHSIPITKVGTYTGVFQNTGTTAAPLVIGFLANDVIQGTPNGAQHYIKIEAVKLNSVASLTDNVTLQGPGLDKMLRAILVGHGPFSDGDYSSTGAQAIDAATGYQCGLYLSPDDDVQVQDAADRILDSWCAKLYVNRSNQADTFRLFAPESVAAGSIAGSLTATDVIGVLTPVEDLAEGLTTRGVGCPNINPYVLNDFANVSLDDVPQTVRQQLIAENQWSVTANVTLAERYKAAERAKPLKMQLDRQADGQVEIDRVCGLYVDDRNFYEGTFVSPIGKQFEIGQVWNVTYPIPELANGKQLLIVAVTDSPSEELAALVFWGL